MIHSLVHITGRSLISDIADDNLSPPEDLESYYRNEDEIRFHHKSFIDYLLDPSRSLEYCIGMEEMNTRLALACIVTMQTFSLQPLSRIACGTFPLSFTYNLLIPHAECSYLGLCNALLDPSRHWVRNLTANIITSIDVLRPICMLLGYFGSQKNGIWMSEYY
jgi:hypothetical protein